MFTGNKHVLEIKASEEADVTGKWSIRIMVLAGKIMTAEVKEMEKLLMEVINLNRYFRSSYVFVST